jgi:hypothetical protein
MFQLIAHQTKSSARKVLVFQSTQVYQIPQQPFNSIFGNIFNKKKPEQPEIKKQTQADEPTKYHKESV